MTETAKGKWYDNRGLAILWIFVFFPLGIFALWKNSRFSISTKSIISGVIVLSAITFLVASQNAKDAFSETNDLWNAGKKIEAIKIYNDMVASGQMAYLDTADSCPIYQRLIEFKITNGDIEPAKSIIEESMGICSFSFKSATAGNIYKEVQIEYQQKKLASERKAKLGKQFSYSGAHKNLESAIKKSMHDNKSYEHVDTVYRDEGSYLIVKTDFRGKNAFGAMVKQTVTAKVDMDGEIITFRRN